MAQPKSNQGKRDSLEELQGGSFRSAKAASARSRGAGQVGPDSVGENWHWASEEAGIARERDVEPREAVEGWVYWAMQKTGGDRELDEQAAPEQSEALVDGLGHRAQSLRTI
jgi:hypothetical protein